MSGLSRSRLAQLRQHLAALRTPDERVRRDTSAPRTNSVEFREQLAEMRNRVKPLGGFRDYAKKHAERERYRKRALRALHAAVRRRQVNTVAPLDKFQEYAQRRAEREKRVKDGLRIVHKAVRWQLAAAQAEKQYKQRGRFRIVSESAGQK